MVSIHWDPSTSLALRQPSGSVSLAIGVGMMEREDAVLSPVTEQVFSPSKLITYKRLRKGKKASHILVTDDSSPIGHDLVDGGIHGLSSEPQSLSSAAIDSAVASSSFNSWTINEEFDPSKARSGCKRDNADTVGFQGSNDVLGQKEVLQTPQFDRSSKISDIDNNIGCSQIGENIDILQDENTRANRSMPTATDQSRKRKRMRKSKSQCDNRKRSQVSDKLDRKIDKERKDQLYKIHIESQRLLRETRDASFKAIPMVQKPICSVLEKIRQRKLEVSKNLTISDLTNSYVKSDASFLGMQGGSDTQQSNDTADCGTTNEKACLASQESDSDDDQLGEDTDQHQNEDFVPSMLVANLKADPSLLGDDSSEEENYDKENIDPHDLKDPVKAFLDDEAEEEEDSDNYLMYSSEDEDVNDVGNELKDLIAPTCEEKAIDSLRRDELHQKWLEQQDAAATENIIQRLTYGLKQSDSSRFHDQEESDTDVGEISDDLQINHARVKTGRLKQMMSKMFADGEEPFQSDEETETNLVRQLHLEKTEQEGTFFSPIDDESSKECFSLIKKLSIAPQNKKPKTTALSSTLLAGGNSSSSSKQYSFLGRVHSNSLSSGNTQGASTFRSFVFGRDDSNSRSDILGSEDSSNVEDKGKLPSKIVSRKFCSSQVKASTCLPSGGDKSHGPSLFEILKTTSVQLKPCIASASQSSRTIFTQSRSLHPFAAFKPLKR